MMATCISNSATDWLCTILLTLVACCAKLLISQNNVPGVELKGQRFSFCHARVQLEIQPGLNFYCLLVSLTSMEARKLLWVSCGCREGVWRVSEQCLEGFWRVSRVSRRCLEGFWRVSKWCLEVAMSVSGRYLEGV